MIKSSLFSISDFIKQIIDYGNVNAKQSVVLLHWKVNSRQQELMYFGRFQVYYHCHYQFRVTFETVHIMCREYL